MPFQKGNNANPRGRPIGSKNRETLLREERRAIFDEEVSQKWERIIKKLKPEYIADQFLGKAPDEVNVGGALIVQIAKEIAEKHGITQLPENSSDGQPQV